MNLKVLLGSGNEVEFYEDVTSIIVTFAQGGGQDLLQVFARAEGEFARARPGSPVWQSLRYVLGIPGETVKENDE